MLRGIFQNTWKIDPRAVRAYSRIATPPRGFFGELQYAVGCLDQQVRLGYGARRAGKHVVAERMCCSTSDVSRLLVWLEGVRDSEWQASQEWPASVRRALLLLAREQ